METLCSSFGKNERIIDSILHTYSTVRCCSTWSRLSASVG